MTPAEKQITVVSAQYQLSCVLCKLLLLCLYASAHVILTAIQWGGFTHGSIAHGGMVRPSSQGQRRQHPSCGPSQASCSFSFPSCQDLLLHLTFSVLNWGVLLSLGHSGLPLTCPVGRCYCLSLKCKRSTHCLHLKISTWGFEPVSKAT